MSFKNTLTLYVGTAKRVVGTLLGGQQKVQALYNWYSAPKLDPAAFPKDPYKLPKTDVFELVQSESDMRYEGVYQCGFGHLTEFELKAVSVIVKHLKAQSVFEIGTFEGRTALNLALNTPENTRIYTLDLPSTQAKQTQFALEPDEVKYVIADSGKRFKNHPIAPKITHLMGDSATFDFLPYQDSIDFVLVDGAHAREYVQNDSEKALSIVKNGGTIVWANYTTWRGVRETLNDFWEAKGIYADIKHIGGTSLAVLSGVRK